MFHAENYDMIASSRRSWRARGMSRPTIMASRGPFPSNARRRTGPSRWRTLRDASRRVHVSNREAMEEIRRAQSKGLNIMGETAPIPGADRTGHGRPEHGGREIGLLPAPARQGFAGSLLGRPADRRVLLVLLRPLPVPLRRRRRKTDAEGRTSFRWVPNGIPGVGARLPILFSEGVGKGRISLTTSSPSRRPTTRRPTASIRARARSPSAPTRTSRSGIDEDNGDHQPPTTPRLGLHAL